ncbi:MAG: hypothetical protein ACI8QC_002321 [Planctomycetota bacterium]|jgi:hypothetical protein
MLTRPTSRRGSALVLCLILVTLIAGLGAGLVQVSAAHQRKQAQSINNMRALYIAEAGLSEAFLSLSQGRSGEVGNPAELATYAGGYFWVTAEKQADGLIQLRSTGLYRSGRSCLGAVVSSNYNPVGARGVSSLGDLLVGAGSIFGVLDPSGTGATAQLRADGDIIFQGITRDGVGSTSVAGNVQPGPRGIVEGGAYVQISGSIASSLSEMDMPAVRFPSLGPSTGDIEVAARSEVNLNGDQRRGVLTVATGGTLTLTGPAVIYLDQLLVSPGGNLVIDTSNGPVELYLDDSIDLADGSYLSEIGGDPSQAAIIVGSPAAADDGSRSLSAQTMAATGTFSGLIYSPYSTLNLGGTLDIVGAVSAGELSLGAGSNVTYDPSLATSGVGVDGEVRMISWTVLGLPDEPVVQSKLDPKLTIAMLGLAQKPSSEAYEVTRAQIELVTTGDISRTYSGELSAIDWSQVKTVKTIAWWDEASGTYSTKTEVKIITDPDGTYDYEVKTTISSGSL